MVLYKIGGGRIWLNPPYSRPLIEQFVKRLAEHGNGIALLFNRCDSKMFQDVIFKKATAMKFYVTGFVSFALMEHVGTAPVVEVFLLHLAGKMPKF